VEKEGVIDPDSRNANEDGSFSLTATSYLAFVNSFIGVRPFASVFGFARTMTLEMTGQRQVVKMRTRD